VTKVESGVSPLIIFKVDTENRETPGKLPLKSEAGLIKRAKTGDNEAFGVLYGAYVQAIYHYLLVRLSNPQIAEDLTADVFLRVVDGLPRYSDRGLPFGAWLFRIARDRLVDYYRQTTRRPVAELDEGIASVGNDPGSMAEADDLMRLLQGALKQLTDEQRDVIQFRYIEEWSLEETGRVMNKSANAIKALQHRAIKTLSRIMKEHSGREPMSLPLTIINE
jgi:RNA polymerase sigma-70 factor (ECF subfamily)